MQTLTWQRKGGELSPLSGQAAVCFIPQPDAFWTEACLSPSLNLPIPAVLGCPCSMDSLAFPRGLWTHKRSLVADWGGVHSTARVMGMGREMLGALLARFYWQKWCHLCAKQKVHNQGWAGLHYCFHVSRHRHCRCPIRPMVIEKCL